MAKYDPLRDHLRRQTLTELIMPFSEIEALVGPLPPSARRPQWWANIRSENLGRVQRDAWRAAGYDAFLIAGSERVKFVRGAPGMQTPKAVQTAASLPRKPALTTELLLTGGFERVSRWTLTSSGDLALETPLPHVPGVYAFVRKGSVMYVGIAASGLANRLKFYIRPGATQRTSQRVRAKLIEELREVNAIEIFAARPPDASWNGWPVNAAAGLEVGLIAKFDLPWNMRGA